MNLLNVLYLVTYLHIFCAIGPDLLNPNQSKFIQETLADTVYNISKGLLDSNQSKSVQNRLLDILNNITKDVLLNEWKECNACAIEIELKRLQYCNFLADMWHPFHCGDSFLHKNKIVVQNSSLLSTLNVFYDEYIITFDLYYNISTSEITVLMLTDKLGETIIQFDFAADYFKITFGNIEQFKRSQSLWSTIEFKQHFNGSYFNTISINKTDVFLNYNTKPKHFFDINVWIYYQQHNFILENIFIVSKTQGNFFLFLFNLTLFD
ncbi:uncharacterized protein LOC105845691 [Hydra vulgaris]|uniref:uncharacterized protein LOC105845691 n=1 Tax=Hydra vulgaris TaxID=6087 RepID=UPI0032EA4BFA